ncbi:MAG: DUF1456 family protein [Flavobacterium sp.]|nr:DUF1456 family protein [Flavobacterium sp.]
MTNNDIFKKLRVALQLRDDQIVEILQLVDFRMSKGELGNFFRDEKHPKYMECGDQVLRNFLNGLVVYLRGTKESPKVPMEVLATHKKQEVKTEKPKVAEKPKATKKVFVEKKKPVVQKVKFKNGKKKND